LPREFFLCRTRDVTELSRPAILELLRRKLRSPWQTLNLPMFRHGATGLRSGGGNVGCDHEVRSMAPLKNLRHEAFAQQLVIGQKTGWTQGAAYSRAGYAAEGKTAEVNASRLLSNANNGIAARVQEIVGRGAQRAAVTVAGLLGELEDARSGASAAQQFGAATGAIVAKGRLSGVWRDRVEIGSVGEFDNLQTPGDVADRLLAEQSPHQLLDVLDVLRAEVLKRAANQATVVSQDEPPQFRSNEGELSLAALRRPPKGARRSA
jgi:hypothetical protein